MNNCDIFMMKTKPEPINLILSQLFLIFPLNPEIEKNDSLFYKVWSEYFDMLQKQLSIIVGHVQPKEFSMHLKPLVSGKQ